MKKESAEKLRELLHIIKKDTGALQNLGRNTDSYHDILINRVVSLLDSRTKRNWELDLAKRAAFPTFEIVDNFLIERIRGLESLNKSSTEQTTTSYAVSKFHKKSSSVTTHLTSPASEKCIICDEEHSILKCKQFKDYSPLDRYNASKKNHLCINCLRSNHKFNECKSKTNCFKCQQRHHTLLHRETSQNNTTEESSSSTPSNNANSQHSGLQVLYHSQMTHFSFSKPIKHTQVLLATARVWVLSPSNRAVRVRALLDQGSTWTFMSRDLARTLNIKLNSVSASLSCVGETEAGTVSSAADIRFSTNSHGESTLETTAVVLPSITAYVPNCKLPIKTWPHLSGLEVADDPYNTDPIHLLIGANIYGEFICDGIKKGGVGEPIAKKTIFGWVLSGNTIQSNKTHTFTVHHCISSKTLDASLKSFWIIEEIPQKQILSVEDELCEEHFRKTVLREKDGRYVVHIPFKSSPPLAIGESRHIAESTLKRIENRLAKDEIHQTMYR